MRLRTKYILFVVILHLIALVLTYFIFRKDKLLFIGSEVIILISLVFAFQLYRQLLQPLQLLLQGAEAIKDRDFNVKFVPTGKYEMDQLINVYNQMIDELRTERTRQEQQHLFLEKLIQTSPTGILILDYDERIHEINPKALKLLDLVEKDVLKKPIDEIDHPVMAQIKRLSSGEATLVTYNGVNTYKLQKSHFIDRGFARHFVMIEELTAEILAAEKKAYGKVIRMMAHEVNNTIGPVNSIIHSALATGKIWDDEDMAPLRNALQVAHDRNSNLNLFMRNFADVVRLPEPVKKELELHQLVRNIAELMQRKAGEKDIRFTDEMPATPFYILGDQQQLEQVFVNIMKNAIEAIEGSGEIKLASNEKHRQLTITDSGKGIAGNSADQLFSPFFSTKKDGQGIGLTLVKEILLNHGFEFSLRTLQPRETVFTVSFNNY